MKENRYFLTLGALAVIVILGAIFWRMQHPIETETAATQRRIQAQIDQMAASWAAEHASSSSVESSSGSSVSSGSGSSVSSADEIGDADIEVRTPLVDQAYSAMEGTTGRDWLTAIAAKKISGTSKFARLEVSISRNGQNTSFQSVVVYFANAVKGGAVNEWRRGRYLDAHLLHACGRAIAPTGSFSTMGVETASKVFDMSAVPTTAEDTCNLETETHDFLAELEKGPIVLGFYPTDFHSRVSVTLVHDGGLTVSPF